MADPVPVLDPKEQAPIRSLRSRRDVVRAGIGLGISATLIGSTLNRSAFAQDDLSTPTGTDASPVADGGASATVEEIAAAIEAEGRTLDRNLHV